MKSVNDDDDDADEFWSVAMLSPSDQPVDYVNETNNSDSSENDKDDGAIQSFTVAPPDSSGDPLTLKLQMNCNDGILSDVSGIPWHASYLLSGYLYGTHEGRRRCYEACFEDNGMLRDGGILELGSGLGIVGLAAAAAALSMYTARANETEEGETDDYKRDNKNKTSVENDHVETNQARNNSSKKYGVVLTDRNNTAILSHLRRNVGANIDRLADASNRGDNHQGSKSASDNLPISVEPCDWMDVSSSLQIHTREQSMVNFPVRPFNIILGSALVYVPEHAAACADTLFYYLACADDNQNESYETQKRQAIILQLPDRSGFTSHFLPRCRELGLTISCQQLDEELVERVQLGCSRGKIHSASDYRLYFIRYCRNNEQE